MGKIKVLTDSKMSTKNNLFWINVKPVSYYLERKFMARN